MEVKEERESKNESNEKVGLIFYFNYPSTCYLTDRSSTRPPATRALTRGTMEGGKDIDAMTCAVYIWLLASIIVLCST